MIPSRSLVKDVCTLVSTLFNKTNKQFQGVLSEIGVFLRF